MMVLIQVILRVPIRDTINVYNIFLVKNFFETSTSLIYVNCLINSALCKVMFGYETSLKPHYVFFYKRWSFFNYTTHISLYFYSGIWVVFCGKSVLLIALYSVYIQWFMKIVALWYFFVKNHGDISKRGLLAMQKLCFHSSKAMLLGT